ncbi:MAG: ATP-binding protein [Caulobacter sp.]|nr:ATP-binding protein [Caulobacter sp.]
MYLLAATAYNFLICLAHPFYETGWSFVILQTLATAAVLTGGGLWFALRRPASLPHLELAALVMNAIFLANVFAYQTLHFEAPKLVYFVLLGLAFAASAPTRRVAIISVTAATACLIAVARHASDEMIDQYAFIGLAGAFTALGMSALLRGVVLRELRARLAAEALNGILELELEANRRLRTQAEALTLAAQTASRAKSEFLATMSHEIRTPLNGVLGAAAVMERGDLAEDQRRRLGLIQNSGQSLLQVINAILDISRIEAGKMELITAPFSLDTLAENLNQLYGALAEDKGLAFSLTVAPEVQGWREGDETRLRQVLSNLISNAVKFTDAGSVRVHLSGDPRSLACSVIDTGVGIPPDEQAAVFEKFVQVDGSITRRTGGSGLGLAICRELLTLMGGRIAVQGAAGGGTRFNFEAPCPAVEAPRTALAPVRPISQALDADARVLIVDDNATNRIVLETMLAQLGVATGSAEDGVEAIELWEAGSWEAILMDIHMPRMDGLQACREIRAREGAGDRGHTPIIAVTASVLSHETQGYYIAGFDGVVAKPIEIRALIAALDTALNGADPVRQAV